MPQAEKLLQIGEAQTSRNFVDLGLVLLDTLLGSTGFSQNPYLGLPLSAHLVHFQALQEKYRYLSYLTLLGARIEFGCFPQIGN